MDERPRNVFISSVLALAAAVGAMAMAFYSITVQDLYATGAFLALGVLTLAFAGGLMQGTQWTWELTMAAGVAIMVLGLAALLLAAVEALPVILLLLVIAVAVLLSSSEDAKYWYLYDRL